MICSGPVGIALWNRYSFYDGFKQGVADFRHHL